jgi:beta-phosphoglucomutase family hydrolase
MKDRRPGTRAVIWDVDGVIVDSGPYHRMAWQQVFAEKGITFTAEDFQRNFGQRNDTIIRNALGADVSSSEMEAVAEKKEEVYRRAARGKLKPLPGVLDLLKGLKAAGFKIGLASSAPPENIRLVTETLGIGDYLDAIVGGRDVVRGKPDPEVFLLAARKLGVAPQDCIGIEDAIAGVAACKAAGMTCIAVTNTHPRESFVHADLVVETLEGITAADFKKLLGRN